jgi:hypothetical protein
VNYGQMIRTAWAMTWRNRFLWVLGLLAGGATSGLFGNRVGWRADRADLGRMGPEVDQIGAMLARGLDGNVGLVVTLIALVVLLALAGVGLSCISQGGLAQATSDLAAGRASSFGRAWRAGVHLFWRYVGLWALLAAAALLGAMLVAGAIVLVLSTGPTPGGLAVLGIVVAVLLGIVGLVAGVALSIVVSFAQRAIAVEDLGPIEALRSGWRLLRGHLEPSLVVWAVSLGLGIVAGLAVAIAVGAGAAVLAVVGVAIWSALGLGAATIAYGALAGLALLLAALVAVAIANTFLWSYWTLAYLRLSGRATPA